MEFHVNIVIIKKVQKSKKRYADRQKQINLALERGEKHIGSKPMASSNQ
jgi:hypothetical protein